MKTQDYRLTTLHFAREWSWRRMLETLLKRTLLHARKLWTKETITGSSRSSKFLDLLNFESRACFIGQLKNKEIEFYALRPLYCLHLSLHKIIPKTFNFWSSNRFNEKFLSKSLSIVNNSLIEELSTRKVKRSMFLVGTRFTLSATES